MLIVIFDFSVGRAEALFERGLSELGRHCQAGMRVVEVLSRLLQLSSDLLIGHRSGVCSLSVIIISFYFFRVINY